MLEKIPESLLPFAFLFLIPFDLWFLSVLLTDVREKFRGRSPPPPVVSSLNLVYAYLTVDPLVSAGICLSLYYLTQPELTALSISALVLRWSGVGFMLAYLSLDLPIKIVIRLLYPMLESRRTWSGWIEKLDGIRCTELADLLLPWIEGMTDVAHWIGISVVGGVVVPYLAVLTVSRAFEHLKAALGLAEVAETVLNLVLSLSDWSGAFVILTLNLNLLILSLPYLTIGQILASEE